MTSSLASTQEQLEQYLVEIQHLPASRLPSNVLVFWQQKSTTWNLLLSVAEDFTCAPASQAFVEWIFLSLWHSQQWSAQQHVQITAKCWLPLVLICDR